MSEKHIVYIVHGPRRYYDEATFSLLTLLHLLKLAKSNEYKIWVWTPHPENLPQHDFISYQRINEALLFQMRGPLDLVHRVKLEVLIKAADKIDGDFVYVDGDTRWLDLPDSEFSALFESPEEPNAVLFMNGVDGILSETFKAGYYRYLMDNQATLSSSFGIGAPPWEVWNAGVLGMKRSCAAAFLEQSITLCDALIPWLKPRIYVEQLALNLVAARRFSIRAFQSPIDHYWDCSFEASIYVQKFLVRIGKVTNLSQQAEAAYTLSWDRKLFRAMQKQPRYRLLRWWHRLRSSANKRALDMRARRLRENAD